MPIWRLLSVSKYPELSQDILTRRLSLYLNLCPDFSPRIPPQFPESPDNQKQGNDKGQDIRQGHGIQNTVEPEENGQHKSEPYAEDYLTDHGKNRRRYRLTHGLQENETGLIDAGKDHHA